MRTREIRRGIKSDSERESDGGCFSSSVVTRVDDLSSSASALPISVSGSYALN